MAVGRVPPPPPARPGLPGRRRLRERVQSERRAVGALVKKAEALLAGRKDVDGDAAAGAEAKSGACALPPRGKKSGRFLNPEAATDAETDEAASATKRRKTIITSPCVEMEVIEPTMSRAERERLYCLIASLSADLPWPPHIVELMQTECCCAVDPNGDKMEINLNSAKDATLFRLLNLLEEFAQQSKIQPRAEDQEPTKIKACVSRSTLCQLEDGELADEDADMEINDVCSGISPLVVEQEEDEFSRDASPVAVDKFPEPSRSNCSPSGSSCRDSSSSSGSESDDDSDSASSGSDEAEAKPLEVEQQVVTEVEMQEVTEQDTGVEPKPLEQQEVTEENTKLTTESEPAAASSGSSSSSSGSGSSASSCSCSSCSSSGSGSDSSDDEEDSASSSPKLHTEAAAKPLEQQQVTQLDKKLTEERPASSCSCSSCSSSRSGSDASDDDEDSASSSPVISNLPTEAAAKPLEQQQATEHDMKLNLAERAAPPATEIEMQEVTEQDIRVEPKPLEQQEATQLNKKLTKERPASPGTDMRELIARAQEKQQLRRRALERKRAREQLEEMERTARAVYEHIDPSVMKQLGITPKVEYMVSSEKSQDSARCLLQKLGLFLKST